MNTELDTPLVSSRISSVDFEKFISEEKPEYLFIEDYYEFSYVCKELREDDCRRIKQVYKEKSEQRWIIIHILFSRSGFGIARLNELLEQLMEIRPEICFTFYVHSMEFSMFEELNSLIKNEALRKRVVFIGFVTSDWRQFIEDQKTFPEWLVTTMAGLTYLYIKNNVADTLTWYDVRKLFGLLPEGLTRLVVAQPLSLESLEDKEQILALCSDVRRSSVSLKLSRIDIDFQMEDVKSIVREALSALNNAHVKFRVILPIQLEALRCFSKQTIEHCCISKNDIEKFKEFVKFITGMMKIKGDSYVTEISPLKDIYSMISLLENPSLIDDESFTPNGTLDINAFVYNSAKEYLFS